MEAQGAYATSIKREINAVGQLIIPLKFWIFLYEKKIRQLLQNMLINVEMPEG